MPGTFTFPSPTFLYSLLPAMDEEEEEEEEVVVVVEGGGGTNDGKKKEGKRVEWKGIATSTGR